MSVRSQLERPANLRPLAEIRQVGRQYCSTQVRLAAGGGSGREAGGGRQETDANASYSGRLESPSFSRPSTYLRRPYTVFDASSQRASSRAYVLESK
jgi:hypothetical protein